ncbi:MAG: HEPN domain-containing protein [bacterium]|nr:HEPN domain-containing protein [bacterium]
MTEENLVIYWQEGAREAWKTAEALMASKRYVHTLFFCHLTLEKALKACYVDVNKVPSPPVHDLNWLAEEAKVSVSDDDKNILAEISKFNIAGRYEDYKLRLHEEATFEYVSRWVGETKRLMDVLLAE